MPPLGPVIISFSTPLTLIVDELSDDLLFESLFEERGVILLRLSKESVLNLKNNFKFNYVNHKK